MHINLSDLEVQQMMGQAIPSGGGDKVNDNFVELYTLLGTGSATSGMSATATVVTLTAVIAKFRLKWF